MRRTSPFLILALLAGCETDSANTETALPTVVPTASADPSPEPTLRPPSPTPLPSYEIHGVPFHITAPGHYRVMSNLVLTGLFARAINVRADDVIVDFGGYSVTNGSTFPRPAGVVVDHASRVEIRGGAIREFWIGVQILDNYGPDGRPAPVDGEQVITGMEIANSTAAAIRLSGNGSIISDNVITNTGGWVAATGSTYTHALSLFGDSLQVVDNLIYGTTNQGTTTSKEAVGVGCGLCPNAVIERNTFAGSPEDCVFSYGVWVSGDRPEHREFWVSVRDNTFDGLSFGIGYGGLSSGAIGSNEFLANSFALYSAPSYEFLTVSSGEQAIVNDAIPEAQWLDVGGNQVLPDVDAWADFETRCPTLFE